MVWHTVRHPTGPRRVRPHGSGPWPPRPDESTDHHQQERPDDDDAKLVDANDTSDIWSDPGTEYNQYGGPIGYEYVRCRVYGIEVIADRRDDPIHCGDCPYGE